MAATRETPSTCGSGVTEMKAYAKRTREGQTMVPFENWDDPDAVGQSEYRAIYECITDALENVEEGKRVTHAITMLAEFESLAREMRRPLEQALASKLED